MKFIILILLFTTPAYAADPFLSDSDGGGSYAGEIVRKKDRLGASKKYSGATAELPNAGVGAVKETAFRGTIDKLFSKTENKVRRRSWTGFERIEGTEAETKFRESSDYKVIEEFSRAIPRRKAFGNKLNAIEGTLRRTRPKKTTVAPPISDKADSFFGR